MEKAFPFCTENFRNFREIGGPGVGEPGEKRGRELGERSGMGGGVNSKGH